MRLYLARHPDRITSKHPRIIEDMLELCENHQLAVDAMIGMLHDLYEFDLETRYAKKLTNYPLWELKTRSRGGEKGGARVYFFVETTLLIFVTPKSKQEINQSNTNSKKP